MPGRLVVFEGIEGVGKSFQLSLLEEKLASLGIPSCRTFEPGGTRLGTEIRQILLRSDGAAREPEAELLLYLADRVQHLREIICPALESGKIVLCDRYHLATLAYQGFARGIGLERIDRLAQSLGILDPDLAIILDLDVQTALSRARRRNREEKQGGMSRFEDEAQSFHEQVRLGYQELARRSPETTFLVDARGEPEEVFGRVFELFEGKIL